MLINQLGLIIYLSQLLALRFKGNVICWCLYKAVQGLVKGAKCVWKTGKREVTLPPCIIVCLRISRTKF